MPTILWISTATTATPASRSGGRTQSERLEYFASNDRSASRFSSSDSTTRVLPSPITDSYRVPQSQPSAPGSMHSCLSTSKQTSGDLRISSILRPEGAQWK